MDQRYYEHEDEAPRFWFSSRFGIAVLGFLGFLVMSSQRMSMTIAMECMINKTAIALEEGEPVPSQTSRNGSAVTQSTTLQGCGVTQELFHVNLSWIQQQSDTGEFVWPESTQNVLFGTFYWGYLLSQIPAGWLAQRVGGKRVFGFFTLAASTTTALVPIGARTHYFVLLALRFVSGVGAGAAFPAMHSMWGRWAPPLERSKLASISYAGALTGSLVTFPITGALCQFGFEGGWPSIFYVLGASGVVWVVVWMLLASESPLHHKRISQQEKDYIVATLAGEANFEPGKDYNISCATVITSLPFLAIVVCNFVYEWGIYTFENSVPRYMQSILKIDLRNNTLYSMTPYVGLWICVILSGIWSDQLRARAVIGTGATRKLMETIGTAIPAAMIVGMGFLDCTMWKAAVSMLIIGVSTCGIQYNGFLVNHIDIAPKYSGILMGLASAFGTIATFVAPFIMSIIVTDNTQEQWQTVFFITASFYVFGMVSFILCGSGDLQPWAAEIPVDSDGTPGSPLTVAPSQLQEDDPFSTKSRPRPLQTRHSSLSLCIGGQTPLSPSNNNHNKSLRHSAPRRNDSSLSLKRIEVALPSKQPLESTPVPKNPTSFHSPLQRQDRYGTLQRGRPSSERFPDAYDFSTLPRKVPSSAPSGRGDFDYPSLPRRQLSYHPTSSSSHTDPYESLSRKQSYPPSSASKRSDLGGASSSRRTRSRNSTGERERERERERDRAMLSVPYDDTLDRKSSKSSRSSRGSRGSGKRSSRISDDPVSAGSLEAYSDLSESIV